MFELNRELGIWRQGFASKAGMQCDDLEELESHLVDHFEALLNSGLSEQAAFLKATQQIGEPIMLAREFEKSRANCSARLWRGFWVAPVVAPLMLALDMLVAGLLFTNSTDPGTPIGVFAMPLAALTLGVGASYLIAITCWMPGVFFLKNRGWLNGGSIHLMGCMLALAIIALLEVAGYYVTTPRPESLLEFFGASLYLTGFILPNVMLSSLVFWLMIRERAQQQDMLEGGLTTDG